MPAADSRDAFSAKICFRTSRCLHSERTPSSIPKSRGRAGRSEPSLPSASARSVVVFRFVIRNPADLPEDSLLPDSRNLALVLNQIEHAGDRRMDGLLREFFPRFERMSTKVSGGTVQFYLHESGFSAPIPATRLSDGTLPVRRATRDAAFALASTSCMYRGAGARIASRCGGTARRPACGSVRENAARGHDTLRRPGVRFDQSSGCHCCLRTHRTGHCIAAPGPRETGGMVRRIPAG